MIATTRPTSIESPDDLIALRRDLHAHPELRFDVERTAGIVARRVRAAGWDVTTGLGRTGVVARSSSGRPGPHVLLRADMDAMPVAETTDASFASTVPGVAHVCGHDVHTAVMIGVAEQLATKELPGGRVDIMFQPAEEMPYGAESGAQAMLDDGLFDGGTPDAAVALHCWPGLAVGTIGIDERVAMAAKNAFGIVLRGRGAHAGTPSRGRDAILGMAQLISALHAGVARSLDADDRAAFNVGTVEGGASQSVVPETAEISGTIRSVDPGVADRLVETVARITAGVAASMDLDHEIEWQTMPAVVNDPRAVACGLEVGREVLGDEDTLRLTAPPMTAEDFALISERVPALYLKLGTCGGTGCAPLHNGGFDPDERAIGVGVAVMTGIASRLLERPLDHWVQV